MTKENKSNKSPNLKEFPQQKTNNVPVSQKKQTGIPPLMQTKFENISGLSFDNVNVHYNSSKPAKVQAKAYTQGNHIYMGPGQEKHLQHELGHIIQQKQGRVKPNTNVLGVSMNHDPKLETEADSIANIALKDGAENINVPANKINQVSSNTIEYATKGQDLDVVKGKLDEVNQLFEMVFSNKSLLQDEEIEILSSIKSTLINYEKQLDKLNADRNTITNKEEPIQCIGLSFLPIFVGAVTGFIGGGVGYMTSGAKSIVAKVSGGLSALSGFTASILSVVQNVSTDFEKKDSGNYAITGLLLLSAASTVFTAYISHLEKVGDEKNENIKKLNYMKKKINKLYSRIVSEGEDLTELEDKMKIYGREVNKKIRELENTKKNNINVSSIENELKELKIDAKNIKSELKELYELKDVARSTKDELGELYFHTVGDLYLISENPSHKPAALASFQTVTQIMDTADDFLYEKNKFATRQQDKMTCKNIEQMQKLLKKNKNGETDKEDILLSEADRRLRLNEGLPYKRSSISFEAGYALNKAMERQNEIGGNDVNQGFNLKKQF